jgi:hypothetical protein
MGKTVGKIAGFLVSPLASLLLKPKKKAPEPVQPVTRQQTPTRAADALNARRGSRDNQRSGSGGGEATGGLKTKLGS